MTPPQAPPRLFDRALIDVRRARAARQGEAAFLLERAASDAVERLALTNRVFPVAAEIGCHGPVFRDAAAAAGLFAVAKIGTLTTSDRSPARAARSGAPALACDEECLPFGDARLDLAVSLLALQWVNDLPGVFAQIRRALKPDGLFMAALVGGDSLTELRQAMGEAEIETLGGMSPRVSPMADVRALGGLLQRAGFALPVVDVDRVRITYETPLRLLADLRAMGATNALTDRHRRPLPRRTLMRAMQIYGDRFAEKGRVLATFDLVHVAGWAPHPAQPKPLKPGSAAARLADVLGADETPRG